MARSGRRHCRKGSSALFVRLKAYYLRACETMQSEAFFLQFDHLPAESDLLRTLGDAALAAARDASAGHLQRENAKEGAVRAFDTAAHAAIERHLKKARLPLILFSEEGVPKRLGRGAPLMRVIVDPVDGSDNFSLGPPFAAMANFCAAITPPAGLLDAATVRAALIRPLAGDACSFLLHRGRAHMERNGETMPLAVNGTRALAEAMISAELNHHAPGRPLAEVLSRARGVRAPGCCSAALLAVARGQLDAHIDIRNRLTAESWLAAAAMVRAAGGVVILLDDALEKADAPANLLQRRSLIAAASRDLMEEILAHLRKAFL